MASVLAALAPGTMTPPLAAPEARLEAKDASEDYELPDDAEVQAMFRTAMERVWKWAFAVLSLIGSYERSDGECGQRGAVLRACITYRS